MCTEREMTLQEWVERLPEHHCARKQYNELVGNLNKLLHPPNNESYPKDWIHIDLMLSPDGKTVNAIGGTRESGEGDMPFLGFPLLKEHYEHSLKQKFARFLVQYASMFVDDESLGKCIRNISDKLLAKDSIWEDSHHENQKRRKAGGN